MQKRERLRERVRVLRNAIRYPRDQKGDDRCWMDDWIVWALLEDTPPELLQPPPYPEAMARCLEFYTYRRSETADPVPEGAQTDPSRWDDDLANPDILILSAECARVEEAMRVHRDIPPDRPRTLEDDRRLYAVLPEQVPADFRLPPEEEFLGEMRAPHAGCPAFWRSHANCPSSCHNLHRWGPCLAT